MEKRWALMAAAAALAFGAPAVSHAQAVYKCGARSYSQSPCSSRVVRTYDAPVEAPAKPFVVVAHRLPGESDEQFASRKRRVNLTESDRDECARLDHKIPFERERLKTSQQQEEVDEVQDALGEARRRYRQLKC